MTLLLHKSGVGGVRAELDRSGLQAVLQTKQRVLQSQLSFFQSQEQLQSRLTSLPPSPSPHLLLTAIRNSPRKIAVIVEVARLTPAESPEDLAARCRKYGRLGIDAISVCTDEETSPDGLADLKAVCSVSRVPVIRRDWFLHPLQIAETREAGAAALPLVCTVLGNGLPALYSYAHYLGLDSIVEIVNLKDLEAMSQLGIPLYGINLSIKLSLPVPGLRQDVAKSLLQQMPDDAQSIVGILSLDEAMELKSTGPSALYLRHNIWQGTKNGELQDEAFLRKLLKMLSNS